MVLRLLSAVGLVFIVYQIAQEPSNIDDLTSFTGDSIHDMFEWGNERFVQGRIADGSKNGTKRKKTHHEIFMEAIMEAEEEEKAPAAATETTAGANETSSSEHEHVPEALRDDHPDYQVNHDALDDDLDNDSTAASEPEIKATSESDAKTPETVKASESANKDKTAPEGGVKKEEKKTAELWLTTNRKITFSFFNLVSH